MGLLIARLSPLLHHEDSGPSDKSHQRLMGIGLKVMTIMRCTVAGVTDWAAFKLNLLVNANNFVFPSFFDPQFM